MDSYDVLLKFESLEATGPQEAAAEIFNAFFKESFWQPDVFDVTCNSTGEIVEVELDDLRNDCPLYGPQAISERLREPAKVLVEDITTIQQGVIVIGTIQSGVLKVGDSIYAIIDDFGYFCIVAGITIDRELHDVAYFTEEVGILFKEPHAINFAPGVVLTSHSGA